MVSSGMLSRVALVRTDVSEELSASFIRVTRIGELRTTQAATSNHVLSLVTLWTNVYITSKQKLTPWPLVRKRTIPTERPPLVGEI
jgi:hypothetical protein